MIKFLITHFIINSISVKINFKINLIYYLINKLILFI